MGKSADALPSTDAVPSTTEALKDAHPPHHAKTFAAPSKDTIYFSPFALLLLLGWHAITHSTMVNLPVPQVWMEVGFAFALGSALNSVHAMFMWRASIISWSVMLLILPYILPLQYGIAASAIALMNFIGVWKAADALGGTQPAAIMEGGLIARVLHFASPVEFRILKEHGQGREGHTKILSARTGLWKVELSQTARDYAALALTASVRAALRAPSPVLPDALRGGGVLYAEVWTIYLFLRLFTGAFSTLLAACGFQAQPMWAAPLTHATCISDFWSRRWNLLIHGLFRRTVFKPLTTRGVPAWAAGALAFFISGAFHEYAFALQQPALRASTGRCLLFFVAQAPVVSAEKALRRYVGVPPPFDRSTVLCTLAWTLLLVPPAPLFLHPLKTSGVFEQIYDLVPRLVFGGR